ncbi:MAG TPA: HAMP domain-containing sensor histidine kinase [Streptosporangiaceae bacterium]|nr:HAMP domain-containing sensor histidine kinase [Streptosporangiaceae bacterium]
MAKLGRPWIGQLGLRLALAFVGVALAAVCASIALGSVTTERDIDQMIRGQHRDLLRATARSAAAAYHRGAWRPADLTVLVDFVNRAGAAVLVRDDDGLGVTSSREFGSSDRSSQMSAPVRLRGARIGTVVVRFDNTGLGATIRTFQSQWWPSRVTAAGVAAVIALLVALIVSRRITAPVESLIDTARARARGQPGSRAGDVRGLGEIQDLAEAFDEMADAKEEQDQLRRNLVADVAHELRTPIAVLQAGHEAMLDGLTGPTSANLSSLRDEVLRLARMVDDLQRLASAEAAALQLTLVPCDLAATVATAADSLSDAFASAGLTLERQLTAVQVRCDPLRIHEVTTNLLINAMKFTEAGGRVVVETALDEGQDERRAVLRVTDTGVGIPAREVPLATQRFFRGQRSSGVAGSGIGLTIVAELVRAHHGTMGITSEPGTGTRVTITLPAAVGDVSLEPNVRNQAMSKRREPEPRPAASS